jgi:hypothetical protein
MLLFLFHGLLIAVPVAFGTAWLLGRLPASSADKKPELPADSAQSYKVVLILAAVAILYSVVHSFLK